MGHYCRICGHVRANEQFSGKGKVHICKRCQKIPKIERRRIENTDEILGFMRQSHISEKNLARLEKLSKSEDPEVGKLAATVLEVGKVTPYKRRRFKILARNHREVIYKLEKCGLISVYAEDSLPFNGFLQEDFDETDPSIAEEPTFGIPEKPELEISSAELDLEIPF